MTQLVWPNGTTTEPTRSDGYGPRPSIETKAGLTRPFHAGTDHHSIGVLRAIGDGTVIESGWISWAGYYVLIYLGEIDGVRTWVRYCHLRAPSHLGRGDTVRRGEQIGYEGDTGQAGGVHLHWEIYRGRVDRGDWDDPGATVDPRAFIAAHLSGSTKGITVKQYSNRDASARTGGRPLAPGGHLHLHTKQGVPAKDASNVVGGVGPYSITPHLYAEGEPGDLLVLKLLWQHAKTGKTSAHYAEELVIGPEGTLKASREFKRHVNSGYRVFVHVEAAATNRKPARITLLDCDAYLFA